MSKTIYLYKYGNLCNEITGGWGSFTHEKYSSGKTKVTFNSENVLLAAYGMGNAHRSEGGGTGFVSSYTGRARMHTVKKIDLTYISSISVIGTATSDDDGEGRFTVRVQNEATGLTNSTYVASTYGNGTVTLDTSGLKGEYYVCVEKSESGSYEKLEDLTYENYSGFSTATITQVYATSENQPPTKPGLLSVSQLRGGKTGWFKWEPSTDPDGNLEGYILEMRTDDGEWKQIYQGSQEIAYFTVPVGADKALFRVKAYDTAGDSSEWNTFPQDIQIINNDAPGEPSSLTVALKVFGGGNLSVSWGPATDNNGDLAGYCLERQVDSGAWTEIYKGPALTYTDSITKGWKTVAYRVRAYDSYNEYSGYNTGTTRTVINNSPPIITCSTNNLGVIDEGFEFDYTVSDPDGGTVTVVYKLDGVESILQAVNGQATKTVSYTGNKFMQLPNGDHTIVIEATDSYGEKVTHTVTFTKAVHEAYVSMEEPMTSTQAITVCALSVDSSIPTDATFSIEVTNNAKDPSPVWENCTDAVKGGKNYVFTNKTAANGFAFNFRIRASRGSTGGGGWIKSIVGGFQ